LGYSRTRTFQGCNKVSLSSVFALSQNPEQLTL
jgi:hypothetical protein